GNPRSGQLAAAQCKRTGQDELQQQGERSRGGQGRRRQQQVGRGGQVAGSEVGEGPGLLAWFDQIERSVERQGQARRKRRQDQGESTAPRDDAGKEHAAAESRGGKGSRRRGESQPGLSLDSAAMAAALASLY